MTANNSHRNAKHLYKTSSPEPGRSSQNWSTCPSILNSRTTEPTDPRARYYVTNCPSGKTCSGLAIRRWICGACPFASGESGSSIRFAGQSPSFNGSRSIVSYQAPGFSLSLPSSGLLAVYLEASYGVDEGEKMSWTVSDRNSVSTTHGIKRKLEKNEQCFRTISEFG